MRWRIFFLSLTIVLAAGIAVSRFSADFWSGTQDSSVNIENVAPQEADIRTEALPEEKKTIEPEGRPVDIAVVETEITQDKAPESSLIAGVPFTVQAPFGEWADPVFQNGCEEASLVMAAYWLSGKPLTKEIAKREIAALAGFEDAWLGHSIDTSAEDTLKLFQEYYDITVGAVENDITLMDIRDTLASGALVIIPADGRKLQNPHFKQPGPTRHMLVITGYDAETKEFITNDPGTKHGKGYRYPEKILFDAILDYPTGDHLPLRSMKKVMITVQKL